jgi:hypothetical protein
MHAGLFFGDANPQVEIPEPILIDQGPENWTAYLQTCCRRQRRSVNFFIGFDPLIDKYDDGMHMVLCVAFGSSFKRFVTFSGPLGLVVVPNRDLIGENWVPRRGPCSEIDFGVLWGLPESPKILTQVGTNSASNLGLDEKNSHAYVASLTYLAQPP